MGCRRLLPLLAVAALASAPAAAGTRSSWALPQIKAVVGAGVMGPDVASFRPDAALTRAALEQLVAGLTHGVPAAVAAPTAPVTLGALDARLVNALGLAQTAKTLTRAARAAGLTPPSRFGTEATARLL